MKSPSFAALAAFMAASASASSNSSCRCFPGDTCWPSTASWSALNSTVSGRLVKTVPLGAVCHDPHYDEAACLALQGNWTAPQIQYVLSFFSFLYHVMPLSMRQPR